MFCERRKKAEKLIARRGRCSIEIHKCYRVSHTHRRNFAVKQTAEKEMKIEMNEWHRPKRKTERKRRKSAVNNTLYMHAIIIIINARKNKKKMK